MYFLRRFVKVLYFSALRILRKLQIAMARNEKKCIKTENDDVSLKKLETYGYTFALEAAEKVIGSISNSEISSDVDLSIIVPIYNAHKYIEVLCKSLLNQKTKYSYEVIFVDDGSTDDSFEILSNIAKKNSHMRVFTKQNGGISSARNYGIDKAVGQYLLFVDNDDYLSEDFVEKTLDVAKKENVDIVKVAHSEFDPQNHQRPIIMSESILAHGYMGEKLTKYNGYVWGTVYNRKIWEKVRFPLGAWYEDMITRILLFRIGKGFAYIDTPMYFYYVHASNASKILWNDSNPKALDQLFLTMWFVEYSKLLGLEVDEWTYRIVLEELGVYLYSRTLKLEPEIVEAAFSIACNFVKSVKFQGAKLDKAESLLEKSFITGNIKLYKAVCAYIDCGRRLK